VLFCLCCCICEWYITICECNEASTTSIIRFILSDYCVFGEKWGVWIFWSLVSCINAMSILFVLRKSCSFVVLLLIPFMLNCNIFSVLLVCVLFMYFVLWRTRASLCVWECTTAYLLCSVALVWSECSAFKVKPSLTVIAPNWCLSTREGWWTGALTRSSAPRTTSYCCQYYLYRQCISYCVMYCYQDYLYIFFYSATIIIIISILSSDDDK